MPKERDLSFAKYNISRYHYRELKNFCLRYDEFKAKFCDCYSLNSVSSDGMPHSTEISDSTANAAMRASKYGDLVNLIEECAREVSESTLIYNALLTNVTRGTAYEYLSYVPIGRRQFYEMRHKFFWLLSQKKG